jgi:hypothetical protein
VDLRRVTLDADAAPLVGRVMLDLTADLEYDAVGGLTLGADPVATSMLHAAAARGRRLDAFVVRKAEKAHGLQRRIEGPDVTGRRVLAVEDTSTTGGSVLTAVQARRRRRRRRRHRGPRHRRPGEGGGRGPRLPPRDRPHGPGSVSVPGVVEGYLVAARSAVTLLGEDAVAARWEQPSALAKMTVGALAAHLAGQITAVRDAVLAAPLEVEEPPIELLEHYTRAAWVQAGPDAEANVAIRSSAESTAHGGPEAVLEAALEALGEVAALLAEEVEPRVLRMPQWAWSLRFEDFLVTRMLEITVHSDDLAVSVDVEPPLLPPSVLEPVLSLLVGVAVLRHGQAAVVRALTRRERAPESIAVL